MSAACRGQREEVEQMKNCLQVLSQPTPLSAGEAELASDQQEREGALELLADLCENMDNAAGIARPAPSCQCPAPSVSCPPLCVLPPRQLMSSVAQPLSFVLAYSLASQPPGSPSLIWL